MKPVAGVARELVLHPLPAVAFALPFLQQCAVQRSDDHEVGIHRRIRAARPSHEVPQAACAQGHVGRADDIPAALPRSQRAVIVLAAFCAQIIPHGIAASASAESEASHRLLRIAPENRITRLRRTQAKSVPVLNPVLRAWLGKIHHHALRRHRPGCVLPSLLPRGPRRREDLRKLRGVIPLHIERDFCKGVKRMIGGSARLAKLLRPEAELIRIHRVPRGDRSGGLVVLRLDQIARGQKIRRSLLQRRIERFRHSLQDARTLAGAQFVELRGDFAVRLHRVERCLPVRAADEESRERVVVALRDGVELVIVAARARDGHAEEGLRHHVEPVVHAVRLVLPDVHGRMHLLAEKPKAGADDGFVPARLGMQARTRHQIPRDVLGDKLIVTHIRIQRANHVVAVLKCIRNERLELVPARLRVAHKVEPVPRPAFAEMRRGEKAIHRLFEQ